MWPAWQLFYICIFKVSILPSYFPLFLSLTVKCERKVLSQWFILSLHHATHYVLCSLTHSGTFTFFHILNSFKESPHTDLVIYGQFVFNFCSCLAKGCVKYSPKIRHGFEWERKLPNYQDWLYAFLEVSTANKQWHIDIFGFAFWPL